MNHSNGAIPKVDGDHSPAAGVARFDSSRGGQASAGEPEHRERERKDGGRNPDASKEGGAKTPSARTLRGLDWLNFFLADVQTGVGPFLAIYLAGYGWNEQRVGIALTVGGIAGILIQTPAGALVDHLRSKRALITAGIVALALGALGIVGHRLFDLRQGRNQAFNSAGNVIAGSIVHSFGSNAGFLFLGAVAAAAFGILCFFMPETRDKRFLNPTP